MISDISASYAVGWNAIGLRVNKPARFLIQANYEGRLAVAPLRIGRQVAMTPEMVEQLRMSLSGLAGDEVNQGAPA